MIKSIFLNQNKEYLRIRYEKAIFKETLEFFLTHLVDSLQVGEIYEFYIINDVDEMGDNPNIYIDEIIPIWDPIWDPDEDYLIRGMDEFDEVVEVRLSETEFWTS